MKKKIWLSIAIICILSIFVVAFTFINRLTPENQMMDMLSRLENALGDEWKKQTVTKVSDLIYSDGSGNNIVYHVCTTTYYEADANEHTGLNIEAISAVISPDESESYRECTVSGLPAAIYQKDGRAYLCWTIIPEISCVIEYDPAVESEENMLRMAESVPANKNGNISP